MNKYCLGWVACIAVISCTLSAAQESQVLMTDSGVQIVTIGPGAPPHTVGLQGHRQVITMDTGSRIYGLRYGVALDPNDSKAAIPGEGYIGMPEPVGCNWYAGGFLDVVLNGQSIGKTFIHSLTGRSSGARGTTDFVFDTSQAVVRVRFVARAGEDCLFAQVLLEPKVQITSVRVSVRCYPSAFVSHAGRHVLTVARNLAQGERAELTIVDEWWTLYYDNVYDAGYISAQHTGAGPCAALWLPAQTEKAGFTVASYGIETAFNLKPDLRDFRFVFFDYAGKTNEVAKTDLQARAPSLLRELADFAFTDPNLARWPLAEKQAEVEKVLALVPDDKEAAAQYQRWAGELAAQLELVRSSSSGAILAEAAAAATISQWERGLPALKLKALLNEI
ncbi:MAG: hypothetical protein RBS80_20780 [Thermoguttaceae bacterium]|jgi:hypothetical protein|nr:hypothetical protein [Thermoguttaceae bacterium]